MSLIESQRKATYRLTFTQTTIAGVNLEIANPGGSGKALHLRQGYIQTAGAIAITGKRTSAASSGGTSSAPTPAKIDSSNAASVATVKQFSVAPTPGTTDATVMLFGMNSNTAVQIQNPADDAQKITIRPGEQLALEIDTGAVSTKGYLEWTEENI